MFEKFSRSWEITKLSFGVINKDKELLLFPLLAGIFSIAFILAILFPSITSIITSSVKETGPESYGIMEYLLFFITYLGLAFIATFFNICVVYTTKTRFEGGNATFWKSISFARSRIRLIFKWSITAATVGLILRLIGNVAGQYSRIISGLAWSIATVFVIPAMVYHNLGPTDAIKKSVEILKRTWGESLIRYFGLDMIEFLFLVPGIIAIFILLPAYVISLLSMFVGEPTEMIISTVTVVLSLLYLFGVVIVFTVVGTIFNTALYVYANTGKIPEGYNQETMKNAFKPGKMGNIRLPPSMVNDI